MDTEQLLADAAWLKRLATSLAGNADDADDLVQESWIAAWRRRPETDRSLRPWLAKVVRDVAEMTRRSERDAIAPLHGRAHACDRCEATQRLHGHRPAARAHRSHRDRTLSRSGSAPAGRLP